MLRCTVDEETGLGRNNVRYDLCSDTESQKDITPDARLCQEIREVFGPEWLARRQLRRRLGKVRKATAKNCAAPAVPTSEVVLALGPIRGGDASRDAAANEQFAPIKQLVRRPWG